MVQVSFDRISGGVKNLCYHVMINKYINKKIKNKKLQRQLKMKNKDIQAQQTNDASIFFRTSRRNAYVHQRKMQYKNITIGCKFASRILSRPKADGN